MTTPIHTLIASLDATARTTFAARATIDALSTGLDVASPVARAIDDFYDDVKKLEKLAENIETVTGVLSKFGPAGKVVALLDRVIGQVENRIQALREDADKARDHAVRLEDALDGAGDVLSVIDTVLANTAGDIQGAFGSLIDVAALFERARDDLSPDQRATLERIEALVADLDDGDLAQAREAVSAVASQAAALKDLLAPVERVHGAVAAATRSLGEVTDKLAPLMGPLNTIKAALSPFSWVLDKADWVISKVLDPVLDKLLKATGITGLIDNVAEAISGLLPQADLFNPVNSAFDQVLDKLATEGPKAMLDQLQTDFVARVAGEHGVLAELMGDGDAGADLVIGRNDLFGISSTLRGAGDDDVLSGGVGDDVLKGGGGNDLMVDGAGNDAYHGQGGADAVYFDARIEEAEFVWVDGALRVTHNGQTDQVREVEALLFEDAAIGIAGVEAIEVIDYAGGASRLRGEDGNDVLVGADRADTLIGRNGTDQLFGRDGDDKLIGGGMADDLQGGAGRDLLKGGRHQDRLEGGAGIDDLRGGGNADVFVFTDADITGNRKGDIIRDFKSGQDLIDLTGLDAVDALVFIDEAAFSGTAGELRIAHTDKRSVVEADLDGDGAAEFGIRLGDRVELGADDFLL